MSGYVVFSFLISVAATTWSVVHLKRQKEWRLGVLTLTAAWLAFRDLLLLLRSAGIGSGPLDLGRLHEPATSLWALLVVVVLVQMLQLRRRAEDAVRESETIYRGLFDAIDDAVVLVDRETLLLRDVNYAACVRYGYTRAEMRRMLFTDLSTEPQKAREAIETGESLVEVSLHRKRDGASFAVEIAQNQFDQDGRSMIVCVIRDATERKKSEDILSSRERQLRMHTQALGQLSRSDACEREGLHAAFQEITELATRALEVERVSIWLFDRGRTKIVCRDLFERSWNRHSSGLSLFASDHLSYFKALSLNQVIVADDAVTDPRTREFMETYLRPNSIASKLDAPILLQGQSIGVVCHEQAGQARNWLPEDEAFARAIADFVAHALEVEGRKRAQQTLRENEEWYRALYEDLPSMYLTLDTEENILSVNRYAEEHLGYSAAELLGQPVLTLFYEEDHELVRLHLAHSAKFPENISQCELRIVCRDGRVIWVKGYVRVRPGTDDKPVFLVVCEDVTERRQAEEMMQQINMGLEQALAEHRQAEEAMQQRNMELEQVVAKRRQAEEAMQQRNMGLEQAIAERRRAEEAMQQRNKELEQAVAERTAQLQAANKELESLSSSASRDLPLPLRSMNGFNEALLSEYGDLLDAKAEDYLGRIWTASHYMSHVIDGLLALNRITRREIRQTCVDLSELAHRIAADLQAAHPDHPVDLVIEPGLKVHADLVLTRILLENLLGNAWKSTARSTRPRIELGAIIEDGMAAFFVRDNGVGFDPDLAETLFMPFQPGRSKKEFEGEGIGLAIVHRIMQRHGGRVWAEGRVGRGATFYFQFQDS